MSTLVVVGAQWGDEGKGKVVDVLAAQADMVARFGGGNNAGHTLVVDGHKLITHLVPSGCRYPETACVLGAGMVIDPEVLREEVEELQGHGLLRHGELRVSLDAQVLLPYCRALDGLREDRARSAERRIGTTRRGVGPAYEAKAARRGVKVRDLFEPERLRARIEHNVELVNAELERLAVKDRRFDVSELLEAASSWARWLEPLTCDAGALVDTAVRSGAKVLFEGAQGALLDIDHGTYPYVTSSNTIAGGVCTGIGIGPTLIDRVWGITKAYATRVGAGPFPTRLEGEAGARLREAGAEFGATTGRPRDCGWLDLPALRYAARLSGFTGLCVTKLDVLAALGEVKVCVRYRDGLEPGRDGFDDAVPEYETVTGWDEPGLGPGLARARSLEALPHPVRAYLDRIAEHVGVEVALISLGAERSQTIMVADAF